jgi:hypothetical protein
MAIADRAHRRGDHDPPHAGIARGAQHPQRAVAGRDNHLVLVPGNSGRQWRGDMEHVVATGDRLAPPLVRREVGGKERQVFGRRRPALSQHRLHIGLPVRPAHRGPHRVAGGQKLQDHVDANEAGPAGDQYGAHCQTLLGAPTPRNSHLVTNCLRTSRMDFETGAAYGLLPALKEILS